MIAVVSAVAGAFALSVTHATTSAAVPPCESQPPPSNDTPPASPKNLRIIGGALAALFTLENPADSDSGPSVPEEFDEGLGELEPLVAEGSHTYYETLASRSDCIAAYSLRNQAQIEEYRKSRSLPSDVNYLYPNDPDPRKQDAAKVYIGTTSNNLLTQVHLPVPSYGTQSLLVVWESWWGKEFAFSNTGIDNYKAFQLGSPGCDIWTEPRMRFELAQMAGGEYVGFTDIRQYGNKGPNTVANPQMNGRSYGNNSLGPIANEFGIRPERWARHWLFVSPDGDWYRLSYWVADATQNPVQVYDRVQVNPKLPAPWQCFRLEYNTSSAPNPSLRGPLVAYARNVVMLRGVSNVSALLQRPE
jgi:hypothetical protein